MPAAAVTGPVKLDGIVRYLVSLPRAPWIYAIALSLVLLATLTVAVRSYRAIDAELTQAVLSQNAALAELAAVTLSEKLDRLVDIGVSLADRVRFRQLIDAGKWEEASAILARVRTEFPFVDRVTLSDVDGTTRAGIPAVPEVVGKNFAGRDWYQGVSRSGRPYVSEVYRRAAAPQRNVFAVAIPIRREDAKLIGILLLQVQLGTLFEWTREVDIGEQGYLYIVDHRGRLAFHPRIDLQGDLVDFSSIPAIRVVLAGRKSVDIDAEPAATGGSVKAYEPVRKYGWAVIAEHPANDAFETKNQQLTRLLMAYALTGLFCVVAVYLVSHIAIQRRQAEEDRRMKAELERLVAERTGQLEAANKELESFSYSVSHDLRSPLRAVDGFARILQEEHSAKLDDESRRLLGVIRQSSQKMGQLIDDLLEYSRLGRKSLSSAVFDMNRLVEDALNEILPPEERGPRFTLGKLPPVRGDAALIKQAWLNLLSNAVKFSGKRARPVIEVSGHENGAECVYCVKDNGAGFDMRYYDKLFGVFQRLHRMDDFPGTGVGLAIVQRVIARHGGRVWAEGKVNEGAAFYFSLPRSLSDFGPTNSSGKTAC